MIALRRVSTLLFEPLRLRRLTTVRLRTHQTPRAVRATPAPLPTPLPRPIPQAAPPQAILKPEQRPPQGGEPPREPPRHGPIKADGSYSLVPALSWSTRIKQGVITSIRIPARDDDDVSYCEIDVPITKLMEYSQIENLFAFCLYLDRLVKEGSLRMELERGQVTEGLLEGEIISITLHFEKPAETTGYKFASMGLPRFF